jgi:hypothetical protein
MGKPFVKLWREERELVVFVVLDLSLSMHAGSRSRRDQAVEAAALIAFAAEQTSSPLGSVVFDGDGRSVFNRASARTRCSPSSPRSTSSPRGARSALAPGPRGRRARPPESSLVVAISVFSRRRYEKALAPARKPDVLAFACLAADESLPDAGYLSFRDPEDGVAAVTRLLSALRKRGRESIAGHSSMGASRGPARGYEPRLSTRMRRLVLTPSFRGPRSRGSIDDAPSRPACRFSRSVFSFAQSAVPMGPAGSFVGDRVELRLPRGRFNNAKPIPPPRRYPPSPDADIDLSPSSDFRGVLVSTSSCVETGDLSFPRLRVGRARRSPLEPRRSIVEKTGARSLARPAGPARAGTTYGLYPHPRRARRLLIRPLRWLRVRPGSACHRVPHGAGDGRALRSRLAARARRVGDSGDAMGQGVRLGAARLPRRLADAQIAARTNARSPLMPARARALCR